MDDMAKKLDVLANKNEPMPLLKWYEESYFISSRGIYQHFKDGKLTKEQARKEKESILRTYEEGKEVQRFIVRSYELKEMLKKLIDEGFNTTLEKEIVKYIEDMI